MKKLTKEQKQKLKDAGLGDSYVEEILQESARNFIDNEMPDIEDEDLIDKAIDIYREAFLRG